MLKIWFSKNIISITNNRQNYKKYDKNLIFHKRYYNHSQKV